MGWWKKTTTAEQALTQQILQEGIERRKIDAEVASKMRDLEMKKLELEMEHIEALGEERRKDRADREAVRTARKQAAAHAREVLARKNAAPTQPEADAGICKVCRNSSDPSLTERDITWHVNGHRDGPSLWSQ